MYFLGNMTALKVREYLLVLPIWSYIHLATYPFFLLFSRLIDQDLIVSFLVPLASLIIKINSGKFPKALG